MNPILPALPATRSALFCLALGALLTASPALPAADPWVLTDEDRTNGSATLEALGSVREGATSGTVRIGATDKESVPGVVVSQDGYVITAASEAAQRKPLRAHLADGSSVDVRVVKEDDTLNVVLLKMEDSALPPVKWGESMSLKIGQWLFSMTGRSKEIRMGVMSARRRAIPDSGAVLGVRFGVDDAEVGVIIEEVADDSPADRAGLKDDDVVMAVNGEKVFRNENVARIISAHRPGDVVKVLYSRKGAESECEVKLASKKHVIMNWLGEDFANHGVSLRTDNFPEVIQHDQPLQPEDIGGALFDLEGRAVALNIARVDRVTNYALPVETFLPQVTKWMEEDRKKNGTKNTADAGE
ncbi:S1C family serine protease [Roseimicrobium gellanilyticum]|uniref:S1C family serine protease n=1 Tax=Roseimicrobium gellanilyticum TaxID=748857 RepID=UPI001473AAA6|nr:PDZ domain-containing protein [Roseimicrobium gellanilyticum]